VRAFARSMTTGSATPTFYGPLLLAEDFEATVYFYRNVIGLPVEGRAPHARCISNPSSFSIIDGHWWAEANGDENPDQGQAAVTTFVLMIQVDDLEEVFERVMAREVKFLTPPTERPTLRARNAILRDPDGRFVALTEPIG